jgi:hypothetical protein
MARPEELSFAPLGGVGEIGMNLSIYGLGDRHQRSWLAIALASPSVMRSTCRHRPDRPYRSSKRRKNLLAWC